MPSAVINVKGASRSALGGWPCCASPNKLNEGSSPKRPYGAAMWRERLGAQYKPNSGSEVPRNLPDGTGPTAKSGSSGFYGINYVPDRSPPAPSGADNNTSG